MKRLLIITLAACIILSACATLQFPSVPTFLEWLASCDAGAACTFARYLEWLQGRDIDPERALALSVTGEGLGVSGDVAVDCSSLRVRAWLGAIDLNAPLPGVPTCPDPGTYGWWATIAAARAKCHVGIAWTDAELRERFYGPESYPSGWDALAAGPYEPKRVELADLTGFTERAGPDDLRLLGRSTGEALSLAMAKSKGSGAALDVRLVGGVAANLRLVDLERGYCRNPDPVAVAGMREVAGRERLGFWGWTH